jgi:hypothetical protein
MNSSNWFLSAANVNENQLPAVMGGAWYGIVVVVDGGELYVMSTPVTGGA